jgi:hypothetical protein
MPPSSSDANGQALAYIYFDDEKGRRVAAKLLTPDEARRLSRLHVSGVFIQPIACSIAKLPDSSPVCLHPMHSAWLLGKRPLTSDKQQKRFTFFAVPAPAAPPYCDHSATQASATTAGIRLGRNVT